MFEWITLPNRLIPPADQIDAPPTSEAATLPAISRRRTFMVETVERTEAPPRSSPATLFVMAASVITAYLAVTCAAVVASHRLVAVDHGIPEFDESARGIDMNCSSGTTG
jgi:hypothetical protein